MDATVNVEKIGPLRPGHVLVVRGLGEDFEAAKQIAAMVKDVAPPGVLVAIVEGDQTIEDLGPDEMRTAGWMPISEGDQLLTLVRELVSDDDCWYDHHGYCQGHTIQERPCPHERAKALLEQLGGEG